MDCKRMWRRDIPIDVVEEILMRLPVKDILRCKSLSKTYYALIKNPRFIKRHLPFCSRSNKSKIITVISKLIKSRRTYNLFFVESSSLTEVYAPTPAKTTRSNASISLLVGSSNGLVCAVFDHWQAESATIELWNPATREHMTISHLPNPDPCSTHIGFGYDFASDDHKIVMIRNTRVQWWSMETNDWAEIITAPELVIAPPFITHRTGLFIMGKLYWLASIRKNKNDHVSGRIMSFDLINNSFCSETAVPDALAGGIIVDMNVFDFMGSIALSAGYNCSSPKLDIWVMNDRNKTWAMKLTIGPFPPSVFWYTRVCTDGELLLTNALNSYPKFLLYDLINKTQKPRLTSNVPGDHVLVCSPCSYNESLVSVLDHTSKQ